ncbi:MAG: DMT family transporter [Brevirhabdus sp.]
MTPRQRALFVAILVVLGAGWGMTQPLIKITVEAGYQPLGLIFWQLVISGVVLGVITGIRRRWFRLGRTQLLFALMVAVIGTVLPNTASYRAALHLPAGIMAIAIAAVPLFAFPVAVSLGSERFAWRRMLGLVAGIVGVILLIAPEASLPQAAMAAWIPLALVAPLCYGFEGNIVSRWGTGGLGPIQLLFAASLVGMALSAPLALASGQWITPPWPWQFGLPEMAFFASSLIHALVYSSYVWLVRRTGPVFAAQVAYLVTGFGVLWSMLLLGEGYSTWVWAALAAMFVGLFLVQPRPGDAADKAVA